MFPAIGYTAEQYRNVESIPEIQSEVMTAKLPYSKAKMYLNTVKTEISRVNGTLMDGSFRVVMTWTIKIITSFHCFVSSFLLLCSEFQKFLLAFFDNCQARVFIQPEVAAYITIWRSSALWPTRIIIFEIIVISSMKTSTGLQYKSGINYTWYCKVTSYSFRVLKLTLRQSLKYHDENSEKTNYLKSTHA